MEISSLKFLGLSDKIKDLEERVTVLESYHKEPESQEVKSIELKRWTFNNDYGESMQEGYIDNEEYDLPDDQKVGVYGTMWAIKILPTPSNSITDKFTATCDVPNCECEILNDSTHTKKIVKLVFPQKFTGVYTLTVKASNGVQATHSIEGKTGIWGATIGDEGEEPPTINKTKDSEI